MEIKIDKEAIEREVTAAIVNSAIGEQLEKQINAHLAKRHPYDRETVIETAVREVVTAEVKAMCQQLLANRRDNVRNLIAQKLTDDFMLKVIESMWDFVSEKCWQR